MFLWVDNTTLHAAIRTLSGRAAGEPDVSTFLQFVTEIVFAEKIYFSDFESDSVRQQSAELRNTLIAFGVEPEALVPGGGIAQYEEACRAAGDALARDLRFAVRELPVPTDEFLVSVEPDSRAVPVGGDAAVVELLSRGVVDSNRPSADMLEEKRASGATTYMLASSDKLWEAVLRIKNWPQSPSLPLVPVLMRLYLNEELACQIPETDEDIKVDYAPAVPRARLLDRQNMMALEALEKLVTTMVDQISPRPVPAPSLASALVQRSRDGEPLSIVKESVLARAQATELRKLLAKAVAKRLTDDDFGPLLQTINALSINLAYDLGVEKAPSFGRAFEFQVFGWLPVPFPSIAAAADLIEYKRAQQQIVILSEFVKTLAWQKIDKFAYQRLFEHATSSNQHAG